MILYMSPCLRDCDCIPEHPLRAAAPMELLVDEADADLMLPAPPQNTHSLIL